MRLLIFSDIHLEFGREDLLPSLPDPSTYDVVVAAGDIAYGLNSVKWLEETFPDHPVIYVPGNHCYYKQDYFEVQAQFNKVDGNVHVLNPGTVTIDDVKFIGATMWSNLELKGYPPHPHYRFEQAIADFNVIAVGDKKMSAEFMRTLYSSELAFILNELEDRTTREQMKKTVLVTHFVPSQLLIDSKWLQPQFAILNPYFTNDLDHILFDKGFPLAIYGHTHDRNDIIHPLGPRMVGNPFGYPGENHNTYQWKIVEV